MNKLRNKFFFSGKNVSSFVSNRNEDYHKRVTKATPIESPTKNLRTILNPAYLPRRKNASVIHPLSLESENRKIILAETQTIEPSDEKTIIRRETDDRNEQYFNDPCTSFSEDIQVRNEYEFYSPRRPPNEYYPMEVNCVRTITGE